MKLRNPFAHSRFGHTDDDADLLLLVGAKDDIRFQGKMFEGGEPRLAPDIREYTLAYRRAELINILEVIELANMALARFRPLIMPDHTDEQISMITEQVMSDLGRLELSLSAISTN